MIGRNFHAGHGLAAGVVVGAAATERPLIVFLLGVILGAVLMWSQRLIGRAAHLWLASRKPKPRRRYLPVTSGTEVEDDGLPF